MKTLRRDHHEGGNVKTLRRDHHEGERCQTHDCAMLFYPKGSIIVPTLDCAILNGGYTPIFAESNVRACTCIDSCVRGLGQTRNWCGYVDMCLKIQVAVAIEVILSAGGYVHTDHPTTIFDVEVDALAHTTPWCVHKRSCKFVKSVSTQR